MKQTLRLLTAAGLTLSALSPISAQNWLLTGNDVTAAQYIGTIAGDTDPLNIRTNGVNRITVTSAGKVGIGTTTPSEAFQIGSGFAFHHGGHIALGLGYAPSPGNPVLNNGYVGDFRLDPVNGMLLLGLSDKAYLKGQVPNNAVLARLVIKADGNIGIGVSVPAAQLHINSPSGYASFMLGNNNNTGFHFTTENSTFNIWTGVFGAGINRLKILSNGNVGIGTTDPGAYKLAVEGKLGAREIEVKQGSWADFVFQKEYRLKPLEEVEKFISEHKHLPDVPSEREVIEKGINLGVMDATLLQKIEELTLYLIEQKKLFQNQSNEIENLKLEIRNLKQANRK